MAGEALVGALRVVLGLDTVSFSSLGALTP
jgi:hypothetical protein